MGSGSLKQNIEKEENQWFSIKNAISNVFLMIISVELMFLISKSSGLQAFPFPLPPQGSGGSGGVQAFFIT
jgi:hypothetical protein